MNTVAWALGRPARRPRRSYDHLIAEDGLAENRILYAHGGILVHLPIRPPMLPGKRRFNDPSHLKKCLKISLLWEQITEQFISVISRANVLDGGSKTVTPLPLHLISSNRPESIKVCVWS